MNIVKEGFERAIPDFITAKPKGLLIDGKWVEATTGESAESYNPSTGKVLGHYALANAHDVDLAVAAARRALEGPWGRFTPAERQNVLLKLADLIEQNYDELSLLDTGEPLDRRLHIAELVELYGSQDRSVGHNWQV